MLFARYTKPQNGHNAEIERSKALLTKEASYPVEDVEMEMFHTNIYLEGFPYSFNSSQFDFHNECGVPINIYESPEYNPFL